jgi:hypothetical protein
MMRHDCPSLTAVLETPPKTPGMIADMVRRAFADAMIGYGSWWDYWKERDPQLAAAVQYCPLCGTKLPGGST